MRHAPVPILLFLAGCSTVIVFPPDGGGWPESAAPAWTERPRFALTNNFSDALSFVDLADGEKSPTLLANLPVGDIPVEIEAPHHIAASPDGRFLFFNLSNYAPGTGGGPHGSHGTGVVPGTLVKLDAHALEKVGELQVKANPGDVILSKDGKIAYVSHFDQVLWEEYATSATPEKGWSSIALIDTERMTLAADFLSVCPTAHGEGLSSDGKTLYVTCSFTDELAIVDVTDSAHPKVQKKVFVGSMADGQTSRYFPYALSVSPIDGSVWISNQKSSEVAIYDPALGAVDPGRTIPLVGVPVFGTFSSDGKTYYVTQQQSADLLSAIDVMTKTKIDLPLHFPTAPDACHSPHAVYLEPETDGKAGIVVCEGLHTAGSPFVPGSAVRFLTSSFVATGFVALELFPDGAAYLPGR